MRLAIALLAIILILVVPWPGLFYGLRIKEKSGSGLLILPFFRHHPFSLSYTHPLYIVPVMEYFETRGSTIHLREIITHQWGVADYYNIPGKVQKEGSKIRIRDIQHSVSELLVIIGLTETQRLHWGDRQYALYKMAGPGGVLTIDAPRLSLARYLWKKTMTGNHRYGEK